ncbi:MAG: class I SAM-dependent methyltransferase [Bdellovibrionales bacterium]|nr:class I SAM-dependent methyltransferase [Bdellovibrionales bacterium]
MTKNLPVDCYVLDLACGDNRLVNSLPKGRGTGVDISNYGNCADLVLPSFENLPFSTGSVGAVTVLAAINYFDDPKASLLEIHRVLAPQGVLIVTQLNPQLSKVWHLIRDRKLKRTAYSEEHLKRLCRRTNFEMAFKKTFMFGLNNLYCFRKSKGL